MPVRDWGRLALLAKTLIAAQTSMAQLARRMRRCDVADVRQLAAACEVMPAPDHSSERMLNGDGYGWDHAHAHAMASARPRSPMMEAMGDDGRSGSADVYDGTDADTDASAADDDGTMALPKAIVTLNGDCEMRCADYNVLNTEQHGARRPTATPLQPKPRDARVVLLTADVLSTAGVTMRLEGGGVRLMNANTADEAAARELASPLMLLPLQFCYAETAGVTTLNCWLLLM